MFEVNFLHETTIDRIKGEKFCTVYTSEKTLVKKLEEYLKDFPDSVSLRFRDIENGAIEVQVPADWFRFVKPKAKRTMTEEQKQQAAERMAKARANRKKENVE